MEPSTDALHGWPIIEIDVRELDRAAGHDAAFGALAAALDRGERFAAAWAREQLAGRREASA